MFEFISLTGEQARQLIDTEQVYDAWLAAENDRARRFTGSMEWKTVRGKQYLYRKTGANWRSMGPRREETELTHSQFHAGRDENRERLIALSARIDQQAAVNRAMDIGRMPTMSARIIRALLKAGLLGGSLTIVGTNAIYAYERLGGVRLDSGLLATADIDLLLDSRASLRLAGRDIAMDGLIGLLQRLDSSFRPVAKNSYRAANKDGFMVDLIQPVAANALLPSKNKPHSAIGDDLEPVEIAGLEWLVNSPKLDVTVLDVRGYPCLCTVPDPRSFAIHKLWLSSREDRDPIKKQRDLAQAKMVATLLANRLPHLKLDDPALAAIPSTLRNAVIDLMTGADASKADPAQPDW